MNKTNIKFFALPIGTAIFVLYLSGLIGHPPDPSAAGATLGWIAAFLAFTPLGLAQSGITSGNSMLFATLYFAGNVLGLASTYWHPNWLSITLEAALMIQSIFNLSNAIKEKQTFFAKLEKAEWHRIMAFLIIPALVGIIAAYAMPKAIAPNQSSLLGANLLSLLSFGLIFYPLGKMQSGQWDGSSAKFAAPYLVGCILGLVSAYWWPNVLTITLQASLATQTVANLIYRDK